MEWFLLDESDGRYGADRYGLAFGPVGGLFACVSAAGRDGYAGYGDEGWTPTLHRVGKDGARPECEWKPIWTGAVQASQAKAQRAALAEVVRRTAPGLELIRTALAAPEPDAWCFICGRKHVSACACCNQLTCLQCREGNGSAFCWHCDPEQDGGLDEESHGAVHRLAGAPLP